MATPDQEIVSDIENKAGSLAPMLQHGSVYLQLLL